MVSHTALSEEEKNWKDEKSSFKAFRFIFLSKENEWARQATKQHGYLTMLMMLFKVRNEFN